MEAGGHTEAVLEPHVKDVQVSTERAARAGLVQPPVGSRSLGIATWATGGYLSLNTLANLASDSPVERRVFAPATAVAAALTTLVAWRTRG